MRVVTGRLPLLHQAEVTGTAEDNVSTTCPSSCSRYALPQGSSVFFYLLLIFTSFSGNMTFHLDFHEWIFCSRITFLNSHESLNDKDIF